MKFQKTVEFDLYELGGNSAMQDVIFNVDLVIDAADNIFCTNAQAHEDSIPYLTQIGGPGAVGHWQQLVLGHFENEANASETLGEAMTEEEYDEFEDILMGET